MNEMATVVFSAKPWVGGWNEKKSSYMQFQWVVKDIRRFRWMRQWKMATRIVNGTTIVPHSVVSSPDRNGAGECPAVPVLLLHMQCTLLLHKFINYWPRPTRVQSNRILKIAKCAWRTQKCWAHNDMLWRRVGQTQTTFFAHRMQQLLLRCDRLFFVFFFLCAHCAQ